MIKNDYRCLVCNTDNLNPRLKEEMEHYQRVITMMDEKI